MPKTYRVHVHDHNDQGRWLGSVDYTERPTREQIQNINILGKPGRYEVRINVVQPDSEEAGLSSWLQDGDPYAPDRVASVETGYRYQRPDLVHTTPADVEKYLPANFKVGDVQSWRIIVRGQDDPDGASLEDVIAMLAAGGITATEVEREGINAVYQFRQGKDAGSGSFLNPPGNPAHRYSIYGYHSSGKSRPRTNRPSGPDSIMSIESLAEDEGGYYPAWAVRKARRILAEAQPVMSEKWLRHVYAYFHHSYSPDGTDRNVSNAISVSKLHCRCGEEFWNREGLNYHIDTQRASAKGPKGRPARGNAGHYEISKPLPPAEHHLGYLLVKKYFPDATPRLDLIENPGRGYGNWPCDKCGTKCQYSERLDGWAPYDSPTDDCPKGGKHEVEPYPAQEEAKA